MNALFKDTNGKHTRMPFDTARAFEKRFKRIWGEHWGSETVAKRFHKLYSADNALFEVMQKSPKNFDLAKARIVLDKALNARHFYCRYVGKDVAGLHSWIVVSDPSGFGVIPVDTVASVGLVRLVKGSIKGGVNTRSGWQAVTNVIFDLPNWHVLGQMIAREDVDDPMRAFTMVVDGLSEGVFNNMLKWNTLLYKNKGKLSFNLKTEGGMLMLDVDEFFSPSEWQTRKYTLVRTYYTDEMLTDKHYEICINPDDFK